jgi:peptidoglycan hydrolase-like protein with peptidoglycan-binding domain
VISAGHSAIVRGAEGPEPWGLDEYDENVRVTNRVADYLRAANVGVEVVIDTHSSTQDANLDWLISEHNKRTRDRDVSIHFNSDGTTDGARGTETYYGSQRDWAADVSSNIAIASGLIDRGAKSGSHLRWVNSTEMPATLVEVAFVNAREDCERYHAHFEDICRAIAEGVGDVTIGGRPPVQPPDQPSEPHPPFPEWGDRPEDVPIEDRPTLRQGDEGDDVLDMQRMIPQFSGAFDGEFGPITHDNVVRYQRSRGLEADGICGPITWEALYTHKLPIPPPPAPPGALTAEQQVMVMRIANDSEVADFSWPERGVAPTGFTQGMALSFAQTYKKLKAGHPAAVEMAKARTSSDKDVLNLWRDEFEDEEMPNETAGIDTLRHLYAFMLGSGMRESSGQHCCGRDQSASNVESDTCEAGAFQTSYNASGASSPEFDNLMDEFLEGLHPGYLDAWSEGVSCSSSDWENYGSGRGKEFQELSKNAPAFSAEVHGLTLRNLCNHYGPVIRFEVTLTSDADRMFKAVQAYMDETEPEA